MQPGDEIGYLYDPITLTPITCSQTHILRRIMTRSQIGDSLFYTYREQSRTENFAGPGCYQPGIYLQRR